MGVEALGRPEASDEEMERVKQQVVEVVLGGLLPRR
jgi:hypothetical protein